MENSNECFDKPNISVDHEVWVPGIPVLALGIYSASVNTKLCTARPWREMTQPYSLEGLMLKLKLQYFGHLIWRTDSLEKILMLGKIEGMRRRGQQRMRWLDGITDAMDMSLSKAPGVGYGQGDLVCYSPWGHEVSDMTEQLNWTELKNQRCA